MRTLLAIGIVGMALAGASAASIGGAAERLFIGEDGDGNVVVLRLGAADHVTSCGGLAPSVTACGNGQHTPVNGPASYVHGFLLVPTATVPGAGAVGYSGSLVSTVTDGVDTRVFTCNVWNNALTLPGGLGFPGVAGCAGIGIKPSNTFTHSCASNMPFNQLLGGAASAPGGAGEWRCYVDGANGYPAP